MTLKGFLILALMAAASFPLAAQPVLPDSAARDSGAAASPTPPQPDSAALPAVVATDSLAAPADPADSSRFRWVPPVFRAHHPPPFDPKIAWKRALLFPGWGQMYNRSYWKVPLVYASLGGLGFWIWYNNVYYQSLDQAYKAEYNGANVLAIRIPFGVDNTSYAAAAASDFKNSRDQYRKTRDQAVLIFLAAYGLSAVEAYVDAHLKNFDVSEDLSLRIAPSIQQTAVQQGFSPGVSLTLGFGK